MNDTWNANPIVYDLSSKKFATSPAREKGKEAGWFHHLADDATVDEGVDGVEPITEEEVFGMLQDAGWRVSKVFILTGLVQTSSALLRIRNIRSLSRIC